MTIETKETHIKVTDIVNNKGNIGETSMKDKDKFMKKVQEGLNVNPDSNFVVITYWWGHDNDNRNIARPCGDFYEEYIKKINKFMVNLIYTSTQKVINNIGIEIDNAEKSGNMEEVTRFKKTIQSKIIEAQNNIFINLEKSNGNSFPSLMDKVFKMVKHYMNDVCQHYGIEDKKITPCKELFTKKTKEEKQAEAKKLADIKINGTADELFTKTFKAIINGIIKNKDNLIKLNNIQTQFNSLKAEYLSKKEEFIRENQDGSNIEDLFKEQKNTVDKIAKEKKDLQNELIKTLKNKALGEQYNKPNQSTFDELIEIFQYIPSIKYQDMIENWKESCRNNNCNYLAIEYKDFEGPQGYQLAINAKPKFIKKALELCQGKGVLYIDGDMFIESYPGIFDMEDVDFMARGWWIDPRSSWKMQESIMYDPYNFETSGGTMFFNKTKASKKLLQLWIETAEMDVMAGKADDRVLSLIFNTKAVLLWIKIIQLPIEYLWLTLDYDERMLTEVYDYDVKEMESTILIEHPHCLTSEDTATGAGASNDRQPKYYDFLEDVYPCSEITYEYIMFNTLVKNKGLNDDELSKYMKLSEEEGKSHDDKIKFDINVINLQIANPSLGQSKIIELKKKRDEMKKKLNGTLYLPFLFWYYHYMGDIYYLNDGNQDLIDLEFIDPDDDENNVQPLSIISYKDKFGNKPHPEGEGLSYNRIVEINNKYAIDPDNEQELISESNVTIENKNGIKEISPTEDKFTTNKYLIKLVLKYLIKGDSVIINPKKISGYDSNYYNTLIKRLNNDYQDMEFVFVPELNTSVRRSSFYKPKIDMNQSILFRPDSRLIQFLSMHLSLESFSVFLFNGNYECMSLIRIGYLSKTKLEKSLNESSKMIGGKKNYTTDSLMSNYSNIFSKLFSDKIIKKSIKNKKLLKRNNTRRRDKN